MQKMRVRRTNGKITFILTHCIQVDSLTVICWTSLFVILGASGQFHCFFLLLLFLWQILLSNSVDPDQTPHDVASDLGLTVCL